MKFPSLCIQKTSQKFWQYLLPGLLACVVWSQFLGISHRYAHPFSTLSNASQTATSRAVSANTSLVGFLWDQRSSSEEPNLHSCLLFDAASAADQILTLVSLLVPASEVQHQLIPTQPRLWEADTELAFHSRAPPELA